VHKLLHENLEEFLIIQLIEFICICGELMYGNDDMY
jgi:hypothetical protein